jgi:hypothetical protein
MTTVITNPFRSDFMALCAESRTSIKLCAPYVKADIISEVLSSKRPGIPVWLITKLDYKSFQSGASDVKAMDRVLDEGGKVFNCSNLHAKVYIFDDNKCIISSANLTASGLARNAECGVLMDDNNLVDSALDFYKFTTGDEDVGSISKQNISKITAFLSKIKPAKQIRYPKLSLTPSFTENAIAISKGLSGWKRDVFLLADQLGDTGDTFSSLEVKAMAQQLQGKYPHNSNREAKIRQILQQLRDLGLLEFTSRGVYKKLWD